MEYERLFSLTTMTSGRSLSAEMFVDRLPGHASGECPIPNDSNGMPVAPALQSAGCGDPVRPRQGGGRVGVLHDVILGLGPALITGEPTLLAQLGKAAAPAGQDLVDVGLVAGAEHDRVVRGIESPAQGDGQHDYPQVGSEVSARLG